eukprot:PhM_4_TR52/c0_g1_i1/m.46182
MSSLDAALEPFVPTHLPPKLPRAIPSLGEQPMPAICAKDAATDGLLNLSLPPIPEHVLRAIAAYVPPAAPVVPPQQKQHPVQPPRGAPAPSGGQGQGPQKRYLDETTKSEAVLTPEEQKKFLGGDRSPELLDAVRRAQRAYFDYTKLTVTRCRVCTSPNQKSIPHCCTNHLWLLPHTVASLDTLMSKRAQRLKSFPSYFNEDRTVITVKSLTVGPTPISILHEPHEDSGQPRLRLTARWPQHQLDVTRNPFAAGPSHQLLDQSPSGLGPLLHHTSRQSGGITPEDLDEAVQRQSEKFWRKPVANPDVSRDSTAESLAKKHGCDVVMALSALLAIAVSSADATKAGNYRIPVTVRGGVVFWDKPVARVAYSSKDKNGIFFRNLVRSEASQAANGQEKQYRYAVVMLGELQKQVRVLVRIPYEHEYIYAKMEYHNKAWTQLNDDASAIKLEIYSPTEVVRFHVLRTVLPADMDVLIARINTYTSSLLKVEKFTSDTATDFDADRAAAFVHLHSTVQQASALAVSAGDGHYLVGKARDEVMLWRAVEETHPAATRLIFADRGIGLTEKADQRSSGRDYLPSYTWPYDDRVPFTLTGEECDHKPQHRTVFATVVGEVYSNTSTVYTVGPQGEVLEKE